MSFRDQMLSFTVGVTAGGMFSHAALPVAGASAYRGAVQGYQRGGLGNAMRMAFDASRGSIKASYDMSRWVTEQAGTMGSPIMANVGYGFGLAAPVLSLYGVYGGTRRLLRGRYLTGGLMLGLGALGLSMSTYHGIKMMNNIAPLYQQYLQQQGANP